MLGEMEEVNPIFKGRSITDCIKIGKKFEDTAAYFTDKTMDFDAAKRAVLNDSRASIQSKSCIDGK